MQEIKTEFTLSKNHDYVDNFLNREEQEFSQEIQGQFKSDLMQQAHNQFDSPHLAVKSCHGQHK